MNAERTASRVPVLAAALVAVLAAVGACAPVEHVYLDRDAAPLASDDGAGSDDASAGADADETPDGDARACLSPATVDFGRVAAGASVSRPLEVTSCGTVPLTLRALTVDGAPAFAVDPPAPLPLRLDPGTTGPLTVRFSPAQSGASAGALTLSFEDTDGRRFDGVVPLAGVGE